MKKMFVLWAIVLGVLPAYAQRSYVRRAIEKNIEKKNEAKYGEPGKAKLNTWVDNVNDVSVREKYFFSQSIAYQHKKFRNGKETEKSESIIFANSKESLLATKIDDKRKSVMVIDLKPRVQLLFDNVKMTFFALNQNAFMSRGMQEKADAGTTPSAMANVKATGKTKTILGYTCKQFQKMDNDGKVADDYWVATIADFKGIHFLTPNVVANEGVVLESVSYRNGQIVSSFTATAINKSESFAIEPKQYTRNSMEHTR